jgi:hypothetical protein
MSTTMDPSERLAMNAGRPVDRRSARPDPAVRAEGSEKARERIRDAKRTGRPDLDLSRLQLAVLPLNSPGS